MPNTIQNEDDEAASVEDNYFETFDEGFEEDSGENDGDLESSTDSAADDDTSDESPEDAISQKVAPEQTPAAPIQTAPVEAPTSIQQTPAIPTEATTPQSIPAEAPKPFDMEAYAAEHLPKLEKLYAFSEDEAAQLQTEPELVMPKLAARLHLRIVQDALSGISAVLPQIIQQQQAAAEAERSSWDTFYSVNGDVKGKVTQDQILSIANMYKQINPAAAPDQVIREVGRIIRTSLGLPEQQVAQPSAGPVNSPTPTQQPAPFIPARGSGSGSPVKSKNPWANLAEELDEF